MADNKDFEDKLKGLVDRIKEINLDNKIHPAAPAPCRIGTNTGINGITSIDLFKTTATKKITGVTPFMTQLCSTISSDLYAGSTKEEFNDLIACWV
jgi:hypothetical protein